MNSYDDILQYLITHLTPLAAPGERVDENTDLVRTLGLDSTTLINLLLEIEDTFDVAVPLNALADVETTGQLAAVIHDRLPEED